TAILLPAFLVVLTAALLLFSEAGEDHLFSRDTHGYQVLFGCCRAPVTESEIVLRRSALVAVAFYLQLEVRMLPNNLSQLVRIGFQRLQSIRTQIVAVVVKIRILNAS